MTGCTPESFVTTARGASDWTWRVLPPDRLRSIPPLFRAGTIVRFERPLWIPSSWFSGRLDTFPHLEQGSAAILQVTPRHRANFEIPLGLSATLGSRIGEPRLDIAFLL